MRALIFFLFGVFGVLSVRDLTRRDSITIEAPAAATVDRATIVDIAPNVTDVLPLIALSEGEHVLAVDDQPVANDLVAGQLIDRYRRGQFSYVDITTNLRRILVLQH